MEKIKRIFSPGQDKDNEIMYGTPEPKNIHADGTSGQGPRDTSPSHPEQDPSGALTRGDGPLEGASFSRGAGDSLPAHLETDPAAEKNDHGITRQILNPGGDKYDETMHGTSTAQSGSALEPSSSRTTDANTGEHGGGTVRRIVNPGHGLNDPITFSTTPRPDAAAGIPASQLTTDANVGEHHHGETVTRIVDPGKDKNAPIKFSTAPVPDKAAGIPQDRLTTDANIGEHDPGAMVTRIVDPGKDKNAPIRFETVPREQHERERRGETGGSAIPGTAVPSRLGERGNERTTSSMSLKSGVEGPFATAAADVGMVGTERTLPDRTAAHGTSATDMNPPATTAPSEGRSFPLSGGATTTADSAGRIGTDEAVRADPSMADQSHLGRDAGLAGAGAAGVGALAYEAEKRRQPEDNVSGAGYTGSQQPASDPYDLAAPSPGYGGESGVADQSHLGRDAGLASAGAAGAGALGYKTGKARHPEEGLSSTTAPSSGYAAPSSYAEPSASYAQPSSGYAEPNTADQSHLRRDAGLAGAGAAGVGGLAYEANKARHPEEGMSSSAAPSSSYGEPSASYTQPSSEYAAPTSGYGEPSTEDHSHLGRDAGLAGAGAAGAGALAYEANKARSHREEDISSSTAPTSGYAEPSSTGGLVGSGSSDLGSSNRASHPSEIPGDPFGYHKPDETPVEGYLHHTKGPHSTDMANLLDPHVPGEFPDENGEDRHNHSHLGRDAALGAGAAGGAAGYEASQSRNEPYSGSASGSQYPITTTTNTRSPPSSSQGEPQHHYGRDAALAGGAGAAGLAGYEALKDRDDVPRREQPVIGGSTDPAAVPAGTPIHDQFRGHEGTSQPDPLGSHPPSGTLAPANTLQDASAQPEHHYGRDAALAGGAGAAGLAGYEALKDRHDDALVSQTTGRPTSSTYSQAETAGYAPEVPQKSSLREDPARASQEHHYGRDAAIAGGTTAAGGAGAYAFADDRGDTGPASKTLGPHDSNVANILDPRVKPEPEKMKDSTTAGPYQSDMANKADPRVTSDPSKAAEEERKHLKAEQKKYEKEEKKHEKEEKKLEKKHEKELEKEEKKHAKAVAEEERKQVRDEPHYGRDAAVAGGAGAAGVGAYEAYEKHEANDPANALNPDQQLRQPEYGQDTTGATTDPAHSQDQHHYGRDAAIAGGAGVAGVGAYEATQPSDTTNTLTPTKEDLFQAHREHEHSTHKLEKTPHQVEKHEEKLEKLREKEAAEGGDRGGKKKESLLHRILHPGHKDKHENRSPRASGESSRLSTEGSGFEGKSDIVTEPHTGLPMNVGKYGDGHGGTDAAPQIPGAHQADPSVGADFDDIKKKNTMY